MVVTEGGQTQAAYEMTGYPGKVHDHRVLGKKVLGCRV